MVPVEEGRLLAALIPGARLVLLESANHILLEYEPAWDVFLSEIAAFLGTDSKPGPPIAVADLSARELEVLELVSEGLTNEVIADRLCLSPRTVERHLTNIHAKLRVSGKVGRAFRMVTFDLRGHGLSDKPAGPEHYADGQSWADDVAAVIDQTGLEQPILVAWSYGGYVTADYLRAYGDARIGGINLVGAAVIRRPPTFDHIGPGFLQNAPDMCVPDLSTNIAAARRFLRACTSRPLNDNEMAAALGWNMAVPPPVRGALLSREPDDGDVLASISVPVLVTHGRDDAIILPSMAEHTLNVCPAATASWHDDVGHMPFWEASDRFDRELAGLARAARSRLPGRPGLSVTG